VTSCCAIDFGTSNSGVALPQADGRVVLVDLEDGQSSMPTAVFYLVDDTQGAEPGRVYGRAAVAAYVDGLDGRLMRSMKSILGSGLIEQHTDVGGGRTLRYLDVITGYLRHLKARAEVMTGRDLSKLVLGRPVFFVDDDPQRDAQAQAALEGAAHAVGFRDVSFQFEPIAAALDYERTVAREERVLVADIGGGTSDFSLVCVGPQRRHAADRRDDILANHGVHIAGTDFDRHLELAAILPLAGYRGRGPHGREVPNRVYFDLATWHLINTVYGPARVAELRRMRDFYADGRQFARLLQIVTRRLGHALAAQAEMAKIGVAGGVRQIIDLDAIESGLVATLDPAVARDALEADLERIAAAAVETVSLAGLTSAAVDTVYFTGGSTGLDTLTQKIAQAFPGARHVQGERFASVAQGLGEHALRHYGV
jgi:hypothetical chaperone protein